MLMRRPGAVQCGVSIERRSEEVPSMRRSDPSTVEVTVEGFTCLCWYASLLIPRDQPPLPGQIEPQPNHLSRLE